jgi:hypothetical protein
LYDGATPDGDVGNDAAVDDRGIIVRRSTEEYGQSPGVKRKMPLHVVHTIDWTTMTDARDADARREKTGNDVESGGGVVVDDDDDDGSCRHLRYLRVYIRRPARGWGVSLWQVDVFGAVSN